MKLRKIIAIPDIQAPQHDPTAVATAIKIVKGEKPNKVIHLGDLTALDACSKFKKRKWAEANLTAAQEITAANKILDRFDSVIDGRTKVVFLEGNHERRLEDYILRNARDLGEGFKGLTIQEQLHLDERGYEYVPTGRQPYRIGEVGFLHGWYTNKYHARTHVEDGGENLIYGHVHDLQIHTGKHLDYQEPRIAMSAGCLCKFHQEYNEGRPTNWIHGVAVIYVDEKTGLFWPYFVPIINGKAVFNGKQYSA